MTTPLTAAQLDPLAALAPALGDASATSAHHMDNSRQMTGSKESNSSAIDSTSCEGRPSDPMSGPGTLRVELLTMVAIVIVAGAIAAMWGGWEAGLLVWTIGPIALVVNPVMWAGFSRVRDREDVLQARHDAGEKPRRMPSKWW